MPPIRFAIIDSNTLVCIGLQQLLTDLIPSAEVVVFNSVDEFERHKDSQFIHFFVSSRIYFEHTQFFQERGAKTFVLVNGDMSIKDVFTLNVCQNEKSLIRDIMAMRSHGHDHAISLTQHKNSPSIVLSPRETEVAVLLCKGFINKEIADKLDVGLTTIISHRKNIMEKLNARSLADIIIFCVTNGIVSLEDL